MATGHKSSSYGNWPQSSSMKKGIPYLPDNGMAKFYCCSNTFTGPAMSEMWTCWPHDTYLCRSYSRDTRRRRCGLSPVDQHRGMVLALMICLLTTMANVLVV